MSRPRTAFVFAGGAALGAAQAGMLKALYEANITPDLLTGVSIGAWNAAYLARAPSKEMVDSLCSFWQSLSNQRIFSRFPKLNAIRQLLGRKPHLFSGTGLSEIAAELFSDCSFESLALPLTVLATDVNGAHPKVFREGPLAPAVLASSALPTAFPPVEIAGHWYIDGGVVTNVPLDLAVRMGAERYVVLDAGIPCHRNGEDRPTLPEILGLVSTVASRQRVQSILPHVVAGAPVLYLSLPCPVTQSPFDFSAAGALIASGYESASKLLREGWGTEPGLTGRPHDHEMDLANPWS
ncbi:MAG: patatin-like phospholipase family protein [Chrysiogenetes bacterium]|nr:patatin-like phospholipase family protein [Chrysiogenetes bacterium]